MARSLKRLTARGAQTLRKPGWYADGGGLYLQITSEAARSWVFRYAINGKERYMGLGSANDVSLQAARDSAEAARAVRREGGDPIAARDQKRSATLLESSRAVTFKAAAETFIADREANWRNPKHRGQWKATLETYAYPFIGGMDCSQIGTGDVLRCLDPIWAEKPETAARVRGRIEKVLDAARVRSGKTEAWTNPAKWQGHLKHTLAERPRSKRVKHHPALPYAELPAFMAELRERTSASSQALQFLILCASRTSEVTGADWSEIDMGAGVWTIPADRMKAEVVHKVPLSDAALELLRALPRNALRNGGLVFPGARQGRPLGHMAMLDLLSEMRPGFVVHGLRSTFRDWAAQTSHRNDVVELALAHVNKDKVEAAYKRDDLIALRRPLMADWAKFCAGGAGENVVAFRAAQ